MTNADIISITVTQWVSPILELAASDASGHINNLIGSFMGAKSNMLTKQLSGVLDSIISPKYLVQSANGIIRSHIHDFIKKSKLPDELLQEFSLNIARGMIQTREEEGALDIPFLNIRLTKDDFQRLEDKLSENFNNLGKSVKKTNNDGIQDNIQGAQSGDAIVDK